LSRARLISARRGPRGGAMLARRPEAVFVNDIVEAIDGAFSQQRCILGLPQCSDGNPCPLHAHWRHLAVHLDGELHRLSLADLAGITIRGEVSG
jgi:Rrf2 family protein